MASRAVDGGGIVDVVASAAVKADFDESERQLSAAHLLAPANVNVLRALAQRELNSGLVFNTVQPAVAVAHFHKAVE